MTMTMTRIKLRLDAAAMHSYEPDAFSASIGDTLKIVLSSINDDQVSGKLVAAEVVDDGRAVVLLLECDEEVVRRIQTCRPGDYHIAGFDPPSAEQVSLMTWARERVPQRSEVTYRIEPIDGGDRG